MTFVAGRLIRPANRDRFQPGKRAVLVVGLILVTTACTSGGVSDLGALGDSASEAALTEGQAIRTSAAAVRVQRSGAADSGSAASVRNPRKSGDQMIPIRRGSINEVLTILGRVSTAEEVGLSFSTAGRVEVVSARIGQVVEEGQVLLQADASRPVEELQAAQERLETSKIQLEQARVEAQLRNQEELRSAEQNVTDATMVLLQAEAELKRVNQGPDPADVLRSRQDLAAAEGALAEARHQLARLTSGPDQFEVREAQREVARAELALQKAQAISPSPADAAARQVALQAAQIDHEDASDRLARLQQGADRAAIDSAQRTVGVAQLGVDSAQARLSGLLEWPGQAQRDLAQAQVANARANLERVTGHLQMLQAWHSTEAAQPKGQATQGLLKANSAEVALLERSIAQDEDRVQSLVDQVTAARLVAPFAGVVVQVATAAGQPIEPGRPLLIVAKSGSPVIQASLLEQDAQQLQEGQSATVTLNGTNGKPLDATVLSINRTPTGTASALLQVPLTAETAPYGMPAEAQVILRQKDDALLVPEAAVRSTGGQSYIEYLQGGTARVAEVETGMAGQGQIEIVRGVPEGSLVVLHQ